MPQERTSAPFTFSSNSFHLFLSGAICSSLPIAQTDPPALGYGDWIVQDRTVIRDWDVIMLRGDLKVNSGGSLDLINTTLLFVNALSGDHGITVDVQNDLA